MNYLAHAFLARREPDALVGSLLGDFMAGVDMDALPAGVREGVLHHRRVDRFTDRHPVVACSRRRIDPRFRHLRGIMVDVFYDHFLAGAWRDYSPGQPLVEFTGEVYRALEQHREVLSPRLRAVAPAMSRQDWLASYGAIDNIDRALLGIATRLKRGALLAGGGGELRRQYEALAGDFHEFFPQLVAALGVKS